MLATVLTLLLRLHLHEIFKKLHSVLTSKQFKVHSKFSDKRRYILYAAFVLSTQREQCLSELFEVLKTGGSILVGLVI